MPSLLNWLMQKNNYRDTDKYLSYYPIFYYEGVSTTSSFLIKTSDHFLI